MNQRIPENMDFDFKAPGQVRPESQRYMRVARAIKKELALLLQRGVSDPRLQGAHITRVEVSHDIRSARIYVASPDPAGKQRVMEGMNKARGYFRSHLASVLNLRYTPELLPYYDQAANEAEQVEHLLAELECERGCRGDERGDV